MSYELAVWDGEAPGDRDQAHETYVEMAKRAEESDAPPTPAIRAYLDALLARWPQGDGGPPGPWAGGPLAERASGPFVAFSLRWSRHMDASYVCAELAEDHGLVCWDPQEERLRPSFELHMGDGSQVFDPDRVALGRQLATLSAGNPFAMLHRRQGTYVQVGMGPAGGVDEGSYAVEQRDGSSEPRRVVTTSLDEVRDRFEAFAAAAPAADRTADPATPRDLSPGADRPIPST